MPETDLSRVTWRKSSYSGGNGNCVEIAELPNDMVGVRDSKLPNGPVLKFNRADWAAYIVRVKGGEFGA